MISAKEALRFGLVNHMTSQEELIPKAVEIANSIIKNSPIAVGAAMKAILAGFEDGVNGYEVEIESFGKCFGTEDFREGTDAFLNKRKAEFKGR